MSGRAVSIQARTLDSRALMELTFQLAILTTVPPGAAGAAQPIEKELPQPQEEAALGLVTRKEAPIISSTKSISAPSRSSSEVSSTTTSTPSRIKTTSPSWRVSSKLKPYWKPEQPPPETAIRKKASPTFSAAFNSATRRAAFALTKMRRCGAAPLSGMACSFDLEDCLLNVGNAADLSNRRVIP